MIGLVTQFYRKSFVALECLALSFNTLKAIEANDSKEWSWTVSCHLGKEFVLAFHKSLF